MNKRLMQELREARPKLRMVTPLAYWIIVVFAWFNIFLGISLVLTIDQSRLTAPLLIVNDLFTSQMWGAVFMAVGVLKLFALRTNNWDLSRKSLLVGVGIKAAWAIALIIRSLTSPGTWLVTIIWFGLAMIQIVTFIFFMPPSVGSYKQRRKDRK